MSSNRKGSLRLGLCLAAVGASAFVAPPSLRLVEGRAPDEVALALSPPLEMWRPRSMSVQDALRGFVARPEKTTAPDALASAFRRLDSSHPSSTLLAYAPIDGGVDADGANEPQPPSPPDSRALLGPDFDAFSDALAMYKSGNFPAGDLAASNISAPFALAAAQWAGLRQHPREAGFARLTRFIEQHPDWPGADWLRQRAEEALFGDKHPDKLVAAYFSAAPPKTAAGRIALARVLLRADDVFEAAALVKQAWREDDFNETLENAVKKEFSGFLGVADHKYRADRLLYVEKTGAAMRAAALAGKDAVELARARAAAANDAAGEKTFAALPASVQNDPGLVFARVHMLRVQEKFVEAAALLRDAPTEPRLVVDGDAWWTERRLLARKLMDKGRFPEAYEICARHSARSTSAKVEAEFHAGWIALRFLNDPAKAASHFDRLSRVAETPIQKSRGAYWLARAHEALATPEDAEKARAFFEQAAVHSTTYYGQLASARIGAPDRPLRPDPRLAEGDERAEAVRVVELLLAAGERELAAQLSADAARRLSDDTQLAALADVARRHRDAKLSLTLGKLASYRGVAIDDAAFPDFGIPRFSALPNSAPRSIVYAIARQESAFDPKAVSSAGAMGLMQMIASTARRTAQQTGVGFELKRLVDEPAFNARLGAAHLGILLGEHKGSYILTFAAYNAGGRRVKEWIDAYGDPRKKEVDPIDWVERIPISETRNYVQRVVENFVVYRARFADRDTRAPQQELARVSTTN